MLTNDLIRDHAMIAQNIAIEGVRSGRIVGEQSMRAKAAPVVLALERLIEEAEFALKIGRDTPLLRERVQEARAALEQYRSVAS